MKTSRTFFTLAILPLFIGLFSSSLASASTDFFETNISGNSSKSVAHEVFSDIQVREVTLRAVAEKTRLAQTQFFVAQTKQAAESRFAAGELDQYALRDIQNELSYLVHSMNEYFTNVRAFERSKNSVYKKLSAQNMDDAQMAYGRLKAVTLKTARR